MVTVIARYRARPGAADTVAAILQRHVAASRRELGCVQFEACRSREKPDDFVLFERYVDDRAFAVHRASDHFVANVQNGIVPLLAERVFDLYDEVVPAD